MKTSNNLFNVHNLDSRYLTDIVEKEIVDVTITSPPYFDLKDYGHKDQIGFGQDYNTYLNDLKIVFEQVYLVTKDTGSLWVIIDSFRKDGEVVTLPFDFANKLKEVGWRLKDIIVWSKDRTVPWTHKGQTRGLFEYILVFTKGDNYNYFIDKVRDYESLKQWWIKYPERYNPKGKAPEEIWHFDIPVQGSWGTKYVKHFCPLPEGLVQRVLLITTKEDDVVLDPFSGSGTVPAQALFMKRKPIGFELNIHYIDMYKEYIAKVLSKRTAEYELTKRTKLRKSKFEEIILNLRSLKFARLLYKKFNKEITAIKAVRLKETPAARHKLIKVKYIILFNQKAAQLTEKIQKECSVPPLSKFGIEPEFEFYINLDDFCAQLKEELYQYSSSNTHKYVCVYTGVLVNKHPIISPIMLNLNEKDYD